MRRADRPEDHGARRSQRANWLVRRPVDGGEYAHVGSAGRARRRPGFETEPAPDFDPEVASIFTEEATELIEVCETALSAWREEPTNGERLAALKRPLHTLKGGARMAGIAAMGDLSHELESLVNQVDSGSVPASAATFDALQASLDELARMRDGVAAGRGVAPARDSIARIRALAPSSAARAFEPQPAAEPQRSAARVPATIPSPRPAESPPSLSPSQPVAPEAPAPATRSAEAAEEPTEDEPAPAQPVPPGREPVAPGDRQEMARVDADLLDQLLNISGEVSISRARLEQQLGSIDFNLGELSRTVTRLKEQLRKLEIETEKQILHRHEDDGGHRSDFDPLELDRYSSIQQFSRGLAETASDVASIQQLLETLTQDTQNLLQQQARTVTELQNGLMRTRMVPFQRHVQRLARIVRQAAADTGKRAELIVEGASGELDRQVLERMLPPFEHMLRNAVVHGIETPEQRVARGKPDGGRIELDLQREGAEVMVKVRDDGAGMNLQAIRDKALALGLFSRVSRSPTRMRCSSFSSRGSPPRARLPSKRVAASAWTWSRPKSSASVALCTWRRRPDQARSSRFACRSRSRSAMLSSCARAMSITRCRCRRWRACCACQVGGHGPSGS